MVVLGVSACSPDSPLAEYDFLGVIEEMEIDEWSVFPPDTSSWGGPESALEVGPGRLVLHDGTVLEVSEQTPGSNACRSLDRPSLPLAEPMSRGYERCVVIGAFTDDGPPDVAWFLVLTEEPAYWQYPGDPSLPGVAPGQGRRVVALRNPDQADDETVTIEMAERRFSFPVSPEVVELDCFTGAVVSPGENADSRPDMSPRAYLDAESGMVIAHICLD